MFGRTRALACALLGGLGLLALSGCGPQAFGSDGVHKVSPPGLYTDATLLEHLQKGFYEAKDCAGLAAGEFDDLSVVIMEPQFPCQWYPNGCSGEYVVPNTVKLGSPYVWKHEVIHYLLYVNTGNSDSGHASDLFWQCT